MKVNCSKNYTNILVLFAAFFILMAAWNGTANSYQGSGDLTYLTIDDFEPIFLKALKKYTGWPIEQLDISDLRMFPTRVGVPASAEVEFDIAPPSNSKGLGRVSFLVTVMADQRPVRRVRVNGWVEIYKNVVCATRPLRKGHVLTPEDLTVVKKPLSKLRAEPLYNMKAALGKGLRRSVRSGEVITPIILQEPVLVKRGSRVTIIAQSGSLFVRVPGIVKEKGARGQFIKVQNAMSHRDILAQVLDTKTVKVFF